MVSKSRQRLVCRWTYSGWGIWTDTDVARPCTSLSGPSGEPPPPVWAWFPSPLAGCDPPSSFPPPQFYSRPRHLLLLAVEEHSLFWHSLFSGVLRLQVPPSSAWCCELQCQDYLSYQHLYLQSPCLQWSGQNLPQRLQTFLCSLMIQPLVFCHCLPNSIIHSVK